MCDTRSRVWLEVDLGHLEHNFGVIRDRISPAGVLSVLKANAYGLGVDRIARTLAEAGVCGFGVAELDEALRLKSLGRPVQILGGILPDEIPEAVANDLRIPICDIRSASLVSETAGKLGKTAICHFLVDTGMGRLGIRIEEAERTIMEAVGIQNIRHEGIYSHLPSAYIPSCEYTKTQIDRFKALLSSLAEKGISFDLIHIANSDAVNNYPETFSAPFNMVRTGINLHGSFDPQGQRTMKLKSIVTLKTRLVSVRRLPAGAALGYGCTYKLPAPALVGTISAGYADGLPLALSNRGYVLINGMPCHVLGRVSMDYTTVSLDQVPQAQCGEEVVCLGGQGPLEITVDQWAQLKGTHAYDIICSFGSRVKRRYIPA
ncbi:MAG: alanine racemase [Victivallales bacterium]|nr:alanine racemase [Victivallales bacterium]